MKNSAHEKTIAVHNSSKSTEPTVFVSINTNIINKHHNGNRIFFSKGWENAELTVADFANCIEEGWAYCAQLSGDRKKENFLRSNIVSVDIDSGMTFDEAINHPFCQSHLTLIYQTYSSTIEEPRLRLIFLLPRVITDRREQESINRALNLKFSGDRSTTDAARIFYGHSGIKTMIVNSSINEQVLKELIDIGTPSFSDSYGSQHVASRQSAIRLDPNMILEDERGTRTALKDIQSHTSVKCPYHNDKHPSAFVSRNQRDATYLHCTVCRTTFWMKGGNEDIGFEKYPDFVETLRESNRYVRSNKKTVPKRDWGFEPSEDLLFTPRINFVDEKYFQLTNFPEGITLVRSPKGTGKTSSLQDVISKALINPWSTLETHEETDIDDPPHKTEVDYKVLLIGHRQALIRDLCNRLNLNCYLDDLFGEHNELRQKRYGVCLDSLLKIRWWNRYDVIIIDESEQVLSHFLSDTLSNKEEVFEKLAKLIRETPAVVALDADLGWITYFTLNHLRGISGSTVSPKDQLYMHVNEYKPPKQVIHVFESKTDLIALLMADLCLDKKIYVASNSKKMIDQLRVSIKEKFGSNKQVIAITSDNSNSKEIQNFIQNIKKEAKHLDALMCSPSLGTGVDITFPNQEIVFDRVYGFFESQINTHTDIDQQLSRVRHPKEVRVWLSSRRFNFSTNLSVIKTDLLLDHVVANTAFGFEPVPAYKLAGDDSAFLNMASLIVSQQRASKNNIKKSFINYKIENGYEVITVGKDDDLSVEGMKIYKAAKKNAKKEYTLKLLNAEIIDKQKVADIEGAIYNNEFIPEEEQLSLRRMRLELFHRDKISNKLIDVDREGKYRTAVSNFESIFDSKKVTIPDITELYPDLLMNLLDSEVNVKKFEVGLHKLIKAPLIHDLLLKTPFFNGTEFIPSVKYTAVDLLSLAKIAKKRKKMIEGQLNITVRSDIEKKPTQFLRDLLSLIGLKQKNVAKLKSGNSRIYQYALDADALNQILDVTQRRKEIANPWEFLSNIHGIDLSAPGQNTFDQPLKKYWFDFLKQYEKHKRQNNVKNRAATGG